MSDGQKIKRKCSMRYGSNKINRAGIDLKNFIYNMRRTKSGHFRKQTQHFKTKEKTWISPSLFANRTSFFQSFSDMLASISAKVAALTSLPSAFRMQSVPSR